MTGSAASRTIQQSLEKLLTIEDETERRKYVARHHSLLRAEIVEELANQTKQQIRVDVKQAERLAEATLTIANALNDRESQARALRAMANTLYAQGRNAAAVDLNDQAAALFETAKNAPELARTLSGSIQPLLLLGEYDRAFAAGERARSFFAAVDDARMLARVEINIGNIFYRQDRFAEALASYQRAYAGLLASPNEDTEGIAAVLSNMATCQISLNSFSNALETYGEARRFCQEHAMPLLVSQADYNIAYLYYLRGDYQKAIEMLRGARKNAKEIGDAYHLALCSLDLAELYLELNLSKEADELAREGHAGFRQLGMGYESAKCRAFSAMAAAQEGRSAEALAFFAEAREEFVREQNLAWPSLIDLYRALVRFDEGQLQEARQLCRESLESLRALGLTGKTVLAQLLLARIILATEGPEKASPEVRAALKETAKLERPALHFQAQLLMGDVYAASANTDQAYCAYLDARNSFEALRSTLQREELKIGFLKNRLQVYENLVEICVGRSQAEEALTYIEQAKSRSLMEMFAQPTSVISETEALSSDLAASIRNLREELNWYYKLIEREQFQPEAYSPARIAELQKQARERERNLARALHQAESDVAHPGLANPMPVSLTSIRKAMPPDSMLVEYFVVRDRIFVCLLGQKTLEIFPVTEEKNVSDRLRLLQFQLSKFRLGADYVKLFQESLMHGAQMHLTELHNQLIAPIASRLTASHLVIAPHSVLHYIPFHALFDGTQYLIDRHVISYAPSGSIYALCHARTANSTGPALVFGIPDAQTPGIAEEVGQLHEIIDQSEIFLGHEATQRILQSRGAISRMIHIASHGYFRPDNPMFSSIRLGDSFLSLYDLYQLRLPAELITLSGCSTGLNVVSTGDELIGLVRGLLHAGAQSLLLSLWDVHDQSTSDFMSVFYGLLQQGESKAAAIQKAMIQLRSRYPHPYQWAPFFLVGKS